MTRIGIDPVTRVNGQLRVDAEEVGGYVASAWVSAGIFRGIESVLVGRDPRDAWLMAQRICGTCTGVHALASVRAVEQGLGIVIPANARLIRNIMAGAMIVRDHVMTLYQRSVADWMDVSLAVTADPVATARLAAGQSAWRNSTSTWFSEVRDRLAATLSSDQRSPYGGGWSGHPAYRLSPEQSLVLAAHMLEALDWQAQFLRLEALLGGKDPHPQTYLVGGMAVAPPWGGPAASQMRQHPQVPDRNAPPPLSKEGLDLLADLISTARAFVDQVLVPDTVLLANAYPEYATIGAGPGGYLCNGEFPEDDSARPAMVFPAGRLADGNLEGAQPVSQEDITEAVAHAWYTDPEGGETLVPPAESVTDPVFTASLPLQQLDGAGKYTWVKAPRYNGWPMETGALARVLVGAASGQRAIRATLARHMEQTGLGPEGMTGVLGRMVARAVEAQVLSLRLDGWVRGLRSSLATGDVSVASVELWDPATWPDEFAGWSAGEGPRGSVNHWVHVKNRYVDGYQVVDGSTWNASPRDGLNMAGPLEAALVGTPVADAARPLEILRVVHSMAPCAACAAHVHDPRAGGDVAVRVLVPEAVR
jgi:Ni,Fe-hydrogenase I large subunit